MKKQWFFNDFYSSASRCRDSFRRPLWSPNGAPRLPKMALRRPKMAPRRPKMPPRRPKMAPEVAQKWPKMVPRRPPEDPLSAPTPLRDAAREPLGSRRPQGASRPPQNEPRRWPQDGPICPNLMGNCCLLSSLCFPRRLGDSAAHFLIPTFVQRFAHNR